MEYYEAEYYNPFIDDIDNKDLGMSDTVLTPEEAQIEIDTLRDNLIKAKELIGEQNGILQQIARLPRACAVVLHYKGGVTAIVSFQGKILEVGVTPKISDDIAEGKTVLLSPETAAILDVLPDYNVDGPLLVVQDIIEGKYKVEFGGTARMISGGELHGKMRKGDNVLVDETCSVIMENLGRRDNRFSLVESSGVTWDDIGGLSDAKRDIIESIIEPIQQADIYKFYGRKPTKGILLFGPPRCGKTLLVKATTTAIGEAFGKTAISSGFIYVKGPEILSKYVGIAESNVARLFHKAREHKKTHGYPAVLFIDEAESIMAKRGTGISSDINNTVVPAFLSEMDGLEETGAVIILATNRPDILDPAVVQEGRIDRKIHISRPDKNSARDIFHVHIKGVPLGKGMCYDELVELGTEELFCLEKRMYKIYLKGNQRKRPLYFTFGDICSGAMIAEIIQLSISFAMRRDMKPRKSKAPEKGIRCIDIKNAVKKSFIQNHNVDHTDALSEFVMGFRSEVANIEKIVA